MGAAIRNLSVLLAVCCAGGARASALMDAVAKNDAAAIGEALRAGADIDERHDGGRTALMAACLRGSAAAVRALLDAGADRTIGEAEGYTCAHAAAFQGHDFLVPLLSEYGFDLSDRHADGYTPLHRACWGAKKRYADVVRELLLAGVPADERTADGQLPLQIAKSKHTARVLKDAMGPELLARLREEEAKEDAEAAEAAAGAAGAGAKGEL